MERPRLLRVGLTGGIASGKTTVAEFFRELGAFVVDADRIAHLLMEPDGPAYRSVVDRFGRGILDSGGSIRRSVLGRLVFSDREAREALNAIVHPLVEQEIDARIARHAEAGGSPVAIVDAALLVESGFHREMDRLVVVRCSRSLQIHRLGARGITETEAISRIEAQAPLEDKVALADYIVDTEGTLKETRQQTEKVYAMLVLDFERLSDRPGEQA